MSQQIAKVRKPAPEFEAMAWWGNAFKKVKLSDFKGKSLCLILRQVRRALLLASGLHLRVPH